MLAVRRWVAPDWGLAVSDAMVSIVAHALCDVHCACAQRAAGGVGAGQSDSKRQKRDHFQDTKNLHLNFNAS